MEDEQNATYYSTYPDLDLLQSKEFQRNSDKKTKKMSVTDVGMVPVCLWNPKPAECPFRKWFHCNRMDPWVSFDPLRTELVDCFEKDMERPYANLFRASARGDLEKVTFLLRAGVHPNASKKVALGEALANGHYECAEALLKHGANPNQAVGTRGITPFMMAIGASQHSCLSLLLGRKDLNVDLMDSYGNTPMLYSACVGNFGVTLSLSRHCRTTDIGDSNSELETVISLAALNGHRRYVQKLMSIIHLSDPMVREAALNNVAEVRRLILADENSLYSVDLGDITPLMMCAILDNRECLNVLLAHEAPLELTDNPGRLAIHYAAACGNYYCLLKLIEHGAIVSWSTRQRQTPLMLAAKNGFLQCTGLLIHALLHERLADIGYDIADDEPPTEVINTGSQILCIEGEYLCSLEAFDVSYRTALMHAAENGHVDIVELLLGSGVSVDNASHHTGKTALIHAAASGQVKAVDVLLSGGASINVEDGWRESALCHAVRNGHIPCVRLLLHHGADVSTRLKGKRNLLIMAMELGHVECAEVLMDRMTAADLNFMDIHFRNVIMFACLNDSKRLLLRFLKAGFDAGRIDMFGNTTLMYATYGCSLECMEHLVQTVGVDVNETNEGGLNALGIATLYNQPAFILDYLIKCGCNKDLSAHNQKEETPLYFACRHRNEDNVRLLLSAGVNVTEPTDRGRTPLHHAVLMGDIRISRLLLEAEYARGTMLPDEGHRKILIHLLDHGHGHIIRLFMRNKIFDWDWYPGLLGDVVRTKNRALTRALVMAGISPGKFKHGGKFTSPLMYAIETRDKGTAKYLLSNLYCTVKDLKEIDKYRQNNAPKEMQEIYNDDCMKVIIDAVSSRPLPPATLAFLRASEMITIQCGQRSRTKVVRSLLLPESLKRKLAFEDPVSKLCTQDWNTLDLNLKEDTEEVSGQDQSFLFKCVVRSQPMVPVLYKCWNHRLSCGCGTFGATFEAPPPPPPKKKAQ